MRDVFTYFLELNDDANDDEEEGKRAITSEILRQVAIDLKEEDDPVIAQQMIEVADKEGKGYVTEEDFMNIMKVMGMY